MSNPKISVIMPVYNGEKYLKEAINSILNQTFTDFEFIIINDGSTDNTGNIILSYDDERIIYIKNQENLKISKTLNKGIELAKGEYIARMDADDICFPKRLEKQISFMQKNPKVDVCSSWLKIFGYRRRTWRLFLTHDEIKAFLLFGPALIHPGVLGKRAFFTNLKYRDKFAGAEDYELWVRGVDKYTYANIPQVLFKYRLHHSTTDDIPNANELANSCRTAMLMKCVDDISADDINVFVNLSSKDIMLKDKIRVFNTILNANKVSNYFNQKLLSRVLALEMFNIIKVHGCRFNAFKEGLQIIKYSPFSLFSERAAKSLTKCFFKGF
ncbi:Putative N-acetylgalactosaminyl-diphosphoundecaprenol glucuronosyltransferase [uncultured Candidatus Thioglobus sp.]|nr:Putative N-acetylgalactosaminyl-diphosphoundecaprenol glucuronosyltransferase [uncultured Candidatus Thioglobus sp.]